MLDQVRVMLSLKIAQVIEYGGSDADLDSGCLRDGVQASLITFRPTLGSLSCRHSSTLSLEPATLVRFEELSRELRLSNNRQESASPELVMIGNGHGPGRALDSQLHHDVAPSATHFDVPVVAEDPAGLSPRKSE